MCNKDLTQNEKEEVKKVREGMKVQKKSTTEHSAGKAKNKKTSSFVEYGFPEREDKFLGMNLRRLTNVEDNASDMEYFQEVANTIKVMNTESLMNLLKTDDITDILCLIPKVTTGETPIDLLEPIKVDILNSETKLTLCGRWLKVLLNTVGKVDLHNIINTMIEMHSFDEHLENKVKKDLQKLKNITKETKKLLNAKKGNLYKLLKKLLAGCNAVNVRSKVCNSLSLEGEQVFLKKGTQKTSIAMEIIRVLQANDDNDLLNWNENIKQLLDDRAVNELRGELERNITNSEWRKGTALDNLPEDLRKSKAKAATKFQKELNKLYKQLDTLNRGAVKEIGNLLAVESKGWKHFQALKDFSENFDKARADVEKAAKDKKAADKKAKKARRSSKARPAQKAFTSNATSRRRLIVQRLDRLEMRNTYSATA
jgi:hypothetical protein